MGAMKALATPHPDRGAFTDWTDPRFKPSCHRCREGVVYREDDWFCCSCPRGRARARRAALAFKADWDQATRAAAARGRGGKLARLGDCL